MAYSEQELVRPSGFWEEMMLSLLSNGAEDILEVAGSFVLT